MRRIPAGPNRQHGGFYENRKLAEGKESWGVPGLGLEMVGGLPSSTTSHMAELQRPGELSAEAADQVINAASTKCRLSMGATARFSCLRCSAGSATFRLVRAL